MCRPFADARGAGIGLTASQILGACACRWLADDSTGSYWTTDCHTPKAKPFGTGSRSMTNDKRVAQYACVSTDGQTTDHQLRMLRTVIA